MEGQEPRGCQQGMQDASEAGAWNGGLVLCGAAAEQGG